MRLFLAMAAALLLAGCGVLDVDRPFPPPPTEPEARSFLDRVVAASRTGDMAAMCRVAGGGMCAEIAEQAGGADGVPGEAPLIAGVRSIAPTGTTNGGSPGGWLLVLCGTDGFGNPYRTEMLVSRAPDGRLYAVNAVYWAGFKLAVSNDTGDASGGAGIDCPPEDRG
jgi:hypothetical protein